MRLPSDEFMITGCDITYDRTSGKLSPEFIMFTFAMISFTFLSVRADENSGRLVTLADSCLDLLRKY